MPRPKTIRSTYRGTNVQLPPALRQRAKAAARDRGTSFRAIVETALIDYLRTLEDAKRAS